MVHSVGCHNLVLDALLEQEHAFFEGSYLKCEEILHLIGLIIDPLQFQMRQVTTSCLEETTVEKVIDLLLVDLKKRTTDTVLDVLILIVLHVDFLEQHLDGSRSDAQVATSLNVHNGTTFIGFNVVIPLHRVGLATASLTVCENSCVEPIDDFVHHAVAVALLEHILLIISGVEHSVEFKLFLQLEPVLVRSGFSSLTSQSCWSLNCLS